LSEWKANGAARIVFSATLTHSGWPAANSMMFALLKVEGARRYAREKP
jgi:hypothetical protein